MNRLDTSAKPGIDIWKREKYMLMTWETMGAYLDSLKTQIDAAGIRPTAIVAISRGGMVLGAYLGNRYGIRDVQVLSIIRNTSDEKRSERGEPKLRWMAPDESLQGHCVILADDIAGDGGTLAFAQELLATRRPDSLYTAVIVKNANTRCLPDFHAVEVEEWTIFPWEKPLQDDREQSEFLKC